MNVTVLLFAEARLQLGRPDLTVDVGPKPSVGRLRSEIGRQFPQLRPLLSRSTFAVNRRYAVDETSIAASDEVAWIPPVSGG